MPSEFNRLVLTIGSFDGIHLGHQEIIRRVKEIAQEIKGLSGLVTFHPLPAQVLYPDFPYLLTPLEEKLSLLTELGIEFIQILRFDKHLQSTEAEEFVQKEIVEELAPVAVVIGADHRFGKRGRGDANLLTRLLQPRGIKVELVPEFIHLGAPVKSTRIREHLLLGHIRLAGELLGRPYRITGKVVKGSGMGRQLGFPTLNLEPITKDKLIPAEGVYAVVAEIGVERYGGVVNIGYRPTFGGERRTIELHIIDLTPRDNPNFPPEKVTIHLMEHIRHEQGFTTPAALIERIKEDITIARKIIAREISS